MSHGLHVASNACKYVVVHTSRYDEQIIQKLREGVKDRLRAVLVLVYKTLLAIIPKAMPLSGHPMIVLSTQDAMRSLAGTQKKVLSDSRPLVRTTCALAS